jgi:hypothetical protein
MHLAGTLKLDNKGSFHATAEVNRSRDALRTNRFDSSGAATRGQHLGDDFVGGLRGGGNREEEKDKDAGSFDIHGWR